LLRRNPVNSKDDRRVQQSIQLLLKALDEFPTPEQVFDKNVHHNNDSKSDRNHDVAAQMERLRARFKLLMVQLGMPHFTLQNIFMNDASNNNLPPAALVDDDDTARQIHATSTTDQEQQQTQPDSTTKTTRRQFTRGIQKLPETSDW
jgi:hypothetical protein